MEPTTNVSMQVKETVDKVITNKKPFSKKTSPTDTIVSNVSAMTNASVESQNTEVLGDKQNIYDQFDSIIDSLNTFRNSIVAIQQNIKLLEKNVKKELKIIKKEASKKVKSTREPSGFAKACKVSKELCLFLNKKEDSEMARTDVTKALIQYITKNNLQFSENKKIILRLPQYTKMWLENIDYIDFILL
jgi:chromatin remodeling complex protein RSC6